MGWRLEGSSSGGVTETLQLEGFSVRVCVCVYVNPASYVVNSSLCVHICVTESLWVDVH